MWYANVELHKLSITHDGYVDIVNDSKESKANTEFVDQWKSWKQITTEKAPLVVVSFSMATFLINALCYFSTC